jgi:hypothetical protein
MLPPPLKAIAASMATANVCADSLILSKRYQTRGDPYRTETHKESDVSAADPRPALRRVAPGRLRL